MAQAIQRLYKDAKLTIGPVVEDLFYYDIDMEPVSEADFPKIEAEKPHPHDFIHKPCESGNKKEYEYSHCQQILL